MLLLSLFLGLWGSVLSNWAPGRSGAQGPTYGSWRRSRRRKRRRRWRRRTWRKRVVATLTYVASLVLSLSSLPHSQSFPGSVAKWRESSLCSESVSGITAGKTESTSARLDQRQSESTLTWRAILTSISFAHESPEAVTQ